MKARFLGVFFLLGAAVLNLFTVYIEHGIVLSIGATTALLFGVWLYHLQTMESRTNQIIRALRRNESPKGALRPEIEAFLFRHQKEQERAEQRVSSATEAVTNAKDAEEAAHAVLERSRVAVSIVDKSGKITYVNPSFHKLFRLSRKPEGHRPIEVVPVVEAHDLTEGALKGIEAECHIAHGALDLNLAARPLVGGGAVLWAEDVTSIKQAQKSRQDFVANVSHELRTPSAAIRGYAETILLDADLLPKQFLPMVEAVERNARRLSELFEDLLKLHRVQGRRRQLPLTMLPLLPLLENATEGPGERAALRMQEFSLHCSSAQMGLVHPEALQTIIANLAANAVNYTPEGGTISVSVRDEGARTLIEVKDNGVGISSAHHERIFERFYRVDEARSRSVGGTGLGLAIVRHYALASRAELTLESEQGKGSTFKVWLPSNQ